MKDKRLKHGLFLKNKKMPTFYLLWVKARQKCYNPKNNLYSTFGGKGIKVCSRWNGFKNFQEDMHPKYLEAIKKYGKGNFLFYRIDESKDFSPGNCQFLSKEKAWDKISLRQARHKVVWGGKEISVGKLNKKLGNRVGSRLENGVALKYLFKEKLPFAAKKHGVIFDWNRKFFLKNIESFRENLGTRDFDLLHLHFGEEPMSLKDIGIKMNLTGSRVSQIIIKKLFEIDRIISD